MDCLACKGKNCKLQGKDCPGTRAEILGEYEDPETRRLYRNADGLVAGGLAGSLSRVEELVRFSRSQNYRSIGIAYCFSMEKEAGILQDLLKKEGLKVRSYRCTVNGLTEGEMCPGLPGGVNCNPIGQAEQINAEAPDLVVEMGLCLGHDILFHQYLKRPFTVLAVKDRVHGHNPLKALKSAG